MYLKIHPARQVLLEHWCHWQGHVRIHFLWGGETISIPSTSIQRELGRRHTTRWFKKCDWSIDSTIEMWWVLFHEICRTMYPLTVSIISDSEALYVPLMFPNIFLTEIHDARIFCAPVSWLIIKFTQAILLCRLAEQHPRCRLFGIQYVTNPWRSGETLASKH